MSKVFTVLLLVLVMFAVTTAQEFTLPYMQKVAAPVTVDGVLDEWNFAFPIDIRESTIPAESRCRDWYPDGDEDISGTVMLMWDEEYLYVAANIRDDVPGVLSPAQSWDEDALEIYLANWDVGNVPWDPNGDGMKNEDNGDVSTQLDFHFDSLGDSVRLFQHHPNNKVIKSELTEIVGVEWPNADGYVIEAKVAWEDLASDDKGNLFTLTAGDIIPFTWSLYDRDDWDNSDWAGLAVSERDHPAWQGPGKGWQVIEVRGERETPWYKDASPSFKQAPYELAIDGDLDEWSFCFPVDMNQQTIPDYSRAQGWLSDDDADLSSPIKFMFDENYLYIGAAVRDDVPGVIPEPGEWNQDAIELYLGNYDIIDMMGEVEHSGYINEGDMLDVQLAVYYDADMDSVMVKLWNPVGEWVVGETMGAGYVWPEGDGYNVEVAVSLQDIANLVDVENGVRTFNFVDALWEIWPATYALYDRDDYDSDDWSGYQFVSDEGAPWKGPGGGGWEGAQLLPVNEYDILQELWDNYTAVEDKPTAVVNNYNLSQNYPNPFNPTTNIVFELQAAQNVTLKVYNVLGEEVATVVNGVHTAGVHRVQFDGADLNGGVYFYQLTAGDYSETRRMVLLK